MKPLFASMSLRSLAARRLGRAAGQTPWPGARRSLSAGGARGPLSGPAQVLGEPRLLGLLAAPGGSDRSPSGGLPPSGPSEYELDLGKITDVLVRDYRGFFEHEPTLGIYNEDIVFRVGRPFADALSEARTAVRGRRAYCRGLSAFRGVTRTTVRHADVACSISDGTPYGHALRVDWRFQGDMRLLMCPVYIQAISLYSIAPRVAAAAPEGAAPEGAAPGIKDSGGGRGAGVLSHGVHRHTVEFVEIHPPSLRSLLQKALWQPTTGPVAAPLCFEQD